MLSVTLTYSPLLIFYSQNTTMKPYVRRNLLNLHHRSIITQLQKPPLLNLIYITTPESADTIKASFRIPYLYP